MESIKLYAVRKCYIDGRFYNAGDAWQGDPESAPKHFRRTGRGEAPKVAVIFPVATEKELRQKRLEAAIEKPTVAKKKKGKADADADTDDLME